MMNVMQYEITYYSEAVRLEIEALPFTLRVRYALLTHRMLEVGPNLNEPHTKAIDDGLFELRLKGAEGIARVMYCTLVGRRIVMLHSFIKKTDKTPRRELKVSYDRLKEIKNADAQTNDC
jgi:phage-related protein